MSRAGVLASGKDEPPAPEGSNPVRRWWASLYAGRSTSMPLPDDQASVIVAGDFVTRR
ncbi:MAG: hypothetical protein R2882_15385 [Gemmatimonadales bacterium]